MREDNDATPRDGRIDRYGVRRSGADLLRRSLFYGDGINLTQVADALDPGKDETYGYDAANRLATATGPWGQIDYAYDGAGNRR